MNYLVVGQHKYNSADSWREHLIFSSDKELTDAELEKKFYMHWVYKFFEDDFAFSPEDRKSWTEDDYIETFELNDGDAVVDYILQTEESIPSFKITNVLASSGGG